jgi:hypothetical protein
VELWKVSELLNFEGYRQARGGKKNTARFQQTEQAVLELFIKMEYR